MVVVTVLHIFIKISQLNLGLLHMQGKTIKKNKTILESCCKYSDALKLVLP